MRPPGEREMIGAFQDAFRGGGRFVPDDAEFFSVGRSRAAVAVDTLVAGTDVPPGMGPRRAARKSVVACASDMAAKGVAPSCGVVSVVLPRGTGRRGVDALARGLAEGAAELGFPLLGGDTNEGSELSITVCLAGRPPRRGPPGRGGAAEGDLVYATGPFGYAAAGLSIIMDGARAPRAFGRRAREAVYRPSCRLGFGVAAAEAGAASSSMDSSDGLSATLAEMSRQSGRVFALDGAPAAAGLGEFAAMNGADYAGLVFDGGEEYEIVFTAPPRMARRVGAIAARTGTPAVRIGSVGAAREGGGVVVKREGGGFSRVPDRGWRHFGRGRRRPPRAPAGRPARRGPPP